MSIASFSVRNFILANMLTIVVLVWGTMSALQLQREVFPATELDFVYVRTVYPDASPSEVEDLVTNPVEEKLREVEEIDEYSSSSLEGLSVVVATLDPDAPNKDRAITDIRQKVDRITSFPDDVEDPLIDSITTARSVINVCVYGTASERALRTYVDGLRRRLERIAGVSTVDRLGWRDEEFTVAVDLERLTKQDLSLLDIASALALRNVNLPGGKVVEGGQEVILRTVGKFADEAEIAAVVLRSNPDGKQVRVGDVARVTRGFAEDTVYAKANGSRTLVLSIKKKASGDSIDIADAVKALMAEEVTRMPEGIAFTLVDDDSYYVKRRLHVLQSNGLIGFGLVVLCLFFFLNFRVSFFTAFGIPFSFLATLILMSQFGFTINLMTMFGMIIVLGMLVDDAIIVGENVFRHMEAGMMPADAAIRGTDEVTYPVVATVLTTIAAFLPLAFAPDVYADYLGWLVWVVVFALIASLFEVLFILPSHIADFASPIRRDPDKTSRRGFHPGQALHRGIVALYGRTLKLSLKVRYLFLVVVVLGFGAAGHLAAEKMRIDIFPKDLIDIFFVEVTAPQGTPLAETDRLVQAVEDRMKQLPDSELQDMVSYIGEHLSFDGSQSDRASNKGQVIVYLTPQNTRERTTQAIIDELRPDCLALPGIDEIAFEMVSPGPPVGKPFEMKVQGADYAVLQHISAEMQAFLADQPGVFDITDDFEEGKKEMHVTIRNGEAARLGLDVNTIARSVFAAMEGVEATVVREGKEEIDVKVTLDEPYQRFEVLEQLPVRNHQGRIIKLGRAASLTRVQGLPSIMHYNGDRVITVGANVDTEVTSSAEINLAIEKAFDQVATERPGYALVPAGEWKETKKLIDFMIQAFIVASLMIYTILAVQLRSFLQPLVLLSAIPLGLIGVVLALIAHGKPVSIMAMMGMVGLCGVVVNDAIVLVSFINDQRRAGVSALDAIVIAGKNRFRPILLTTITTVAGLMPVIYGWGGYEPFIAPAAIALSYGLVFASFLTLLVVPCLYMVGVDAKEAVRWGLRLGRSGSDRADPLA